MSINFEKWESKLLPCPFCGRNIPSRENFREPIGIVENERENYIRVVCPCGCSMFQRVKPTINAADELVDKWNRRQR